MQQDNVVLCFALQQLVGAENIGEKSRFKARFFKDSLLLIHIKEVHLFIYTSHHLKRTPSVLRDLMLFSINVCFGLIPL